jgi:hypothetical protein
MPSCSDRELASRARTDAHRADPAGPTVSPAKCCFLGRELLIIRLTLNLSRGKNGGFSYKYFEKPSRTVGGTPWPGVTCRRDDRWIASVKTPNSLMIYMKMRTALLGFPNSSPTIVKVQTAISYGCDCRPSPLCTNAD